MDPIRVKLLPVELMRATAIVLVILLHAAIEPVQVIEEMSSANVTLW